MIWATYTVGALVCLSGTFRADTLGEAIVVGALAALRTLVGGGLMLLALALHLGWLKP